jgi:hypothetical protein
MPKEPSQTFFPMSTQASAARGNRPPATILPASGDLLNRVPIAFVTGSHFSIPWTCPQCGTGWVWVGQELGADLSDDEAAAPPVTVRCWSCRTQSQAVFPASMPNGSLRNPQEWAAHCAASADGPPMEHSLAWQHADASQFARLLVSEIRLYEPEEVEAGRRARDLRRRLQPFIERQRRIYESRVSEAVRRDSAYLDEEIVRVLAGGDEALLGGES